MMRAVILLACRPLPEKPSERLFKSEITQVVKQVASELRNYTARCAASRVPSILWCSRAWRSGVLHKVAERHAG